MQLQGNVLRSVNVRRCNVYSTKPSDKLSLDIPPWAGVTNNGIVTTIARKETAILRNTKSCHVCFVTVKHLIRLLTKLAPENIIVKAAFY